METTQLTVAARAAVALGSSKAEAELTALALQSQSIVAITSADGRAECHAAAMTAKAARVAVEKAAKSARDDATQFSKSVISEEKRLVALIEPEETRLITLRDAWDSEIAREKAAKAEAERLALVEIMNRIAKIKAWPLLTAESTSDAVLHDIERLEDLEIDNSFKTFFGEAAEAKATSLQKLREIYTDKVRAETEAVRIKKEQDEQFAKIQAEREELSRQRAEQAARDAKEKAAEQLIIEAANKRHAEAVERTKQAAVIADSSPVQMQASSPACGSLQPAVSAKQQASQNEHLAQIDAEFEVRDQIVEATLDMSVDEMKIVLHCCERVITERQAAA